jgi:peptidyl-prolyl cis-trans isomerase C
LGNLNVACGLLTACVLSAVLSRAAAADPRPQQTAGAPPAEAAKPVPAQLPDVVARVNGEAVNKADLESAVMQLESRAGRSVPADQRDRVFRSVLDQLIAYRLLAQESVTRKIAVPDAEVDARAAEIRKQFPSDQVFQQTLEQQHMTEAEFREDIRQGLQITGLIDVELATSGAVTAEQVNQFYSSNSFQQGERVRASHILIGVPENADAAARDAARAKAADILNQVKAGGDFAELAKQHSQDPGSAPRGGDLDYFERGQMVGPFEEAAFALAAGQTSELVETRFGYHIIRVVDKQAARTIPLEEVRARIEEYLREQNREKQTQVFIDSLRTKAQIEILM